MRTEIICRLMVNSIEVMGGGVLSKDARGKGQKKRILRAAPILVTRSSDAIEWTVHRTVGHKHSLIEHPASTCSHDPVSGTLLSFSLCTVAEVSLLSVLPSMLIAFPPSGQQSVALGRSHSTLPRESGMAPSSSAKPLSDETNNDAIRGAVVREGANRSGRGSPTIFPGPQ